MTNVSESRGEFDLLEVFSRVHVSRCEDVETNNCLKFLCNTAFSDMIDPCRNTKFPGSMVVSLSRASLPKLKGRASIHVPYKDTDIIPWINPVVRHIPPFQFLEHVQAAPDRHTVSNLPSLSETKYDLDTIKLDFGLEDKLFLIVSPMNVLISQLDFGLADGLFRVCE
jgi:hypothetical protein